MKALIGMYNSFFGMIRPFLQDIFLLLMRISWGWGFFLAGKGKFSDFDKKADFFDSIGIPFPEANVVLAGGTELIGGLLLLVGLGSRIVPIPLIFTMVVAYLTAHYDQLITVWSENSEFTEAAPFLYLLTAIIVLLFGSGRISLDYILFGRNK